MTRFILKIQTKDRIGIIHGVTSILLKYQVNIETNSEYVDNDNKEFFMRVEFIGKINSDKLLSEVKNLFSENSTVTLHQNQSKKVVIFATKESHCLGDILMRYENNDLNIEILGVISNYDALRELTNKFNLPYHYIPVNNLNREEHENKVLEKLEEINSQFEIDYLILAKYMRVLTPKFVEKYSKKIINIHHSFLPAFIGANPYQRAYDRGVKIIGATAHYVTNDLDEGPIITQDINHIDHALSVNELKLIGKDIEKVTLSNAIELVIKEKVFIYNNKTIIL